MYRNEKGGLVWAAFRVVCFLHVTEVACEMQCSLFALALRRALSSTEIPGATMHIEADRVEVSSV